MKTHRVILILAAALLAVIGCESPTDPPAYITITVSGTVRDAKTGEPLSNAKVTRLKTVLIFTDEGEFKNRDKSTTDFTHVQGGYSLTFGVETESVQCRSMHLVVTHADYEFWGSWVEIQCVSELQTIPDIELEPVGG